MTPDVKSLTPRTDAEIARIEAELGDGPPYISEAAVDVCVRLSLTRMCRQLERENARLREALQAIYAEAGPTASLNDWPKLHNIRLLACSALTEPGA